MSAYITLATPMIDRDSLLDALADLGFGSDKVEVHDEPASLIGYEGARRAQEAEIIIRRRHLGQASNDLGFRRTPTGFQAIVSDHDRARFGDAWLGQLHAGYQHHLTRRQEIRAEEERRKLEEERRKVVEAQRQAIHERARKMGYRVEETREGDRLRLVLVKRVY
ncbi:DUF1257 domain-containing protein [Sorangium sp. So ce388]|uniref:DUF1257 domain-containing protein n=1 Tax=Sorangium sp. So ce388 TaxID=3133309 RepID=UPI003F5CB8EF